MNRDLANMQEITASEILSRRFLDIADLEEFLKSAGTQYALDSDSIGKEPPKNKDIAWDPKGEMYYLVLLPRNPKKLYRFRIYPTKGRIYLEEDFAYQNPYQ